MDRKLTLPLALCLLLTACAGAGHTPTPAPTPTAQIDPVPTATPLPAPEWGEQVYMTAFGVEGRMDPVFLPEYRLPKIENAGGVSAYEAINAYYAAALDDLAISAAELAGWAIDDYAVTQVSGDPFFDYVDSETYELTMEASTRVSILRCHYSNSGGPYPTLYPMADTFDLTTGARLSFADLFSCDADEARQRVLTAALTLNSAGKYSNTVLDENTLKDSFWEENFYLSEDSLVVFFPNSEFPRAVGTPTFAIPFVDLEDILLSWE